MRCATSILLAALITASALGEPTRIELQEAIGRALRDNRALDTAALQLGIAEIGRTEAADVFAWHIRPAVGVDQTAEGTDSRVGVSADRRVELGTVIETGVSVLDRGGPDDTRRGTEATISLRQPLLRGAGRTVNRDGLLRAEANVRSARRTFEGERARLVLSVVESHQELVLLQEQMRDDEQSLARADRLRALTLARERQGRASRVDCLRAESQQARAEAELSNARDRRAVLQQEYCELLGLPLDTVVDALAAPALDVPDVLAAVAESVAFSNRLDYAEALQAHAEAQRGILVARDRLLPSVDVLASYGRVGRASSLGEAWSMEDETWSVGLAGDTDLNRRSDRAQVERAQLNAEGADRALGVLEERIRREVQQALIQYQRARTQEEFAVRTVELARTRARLAQRMFETGRGDQFTALDAESEWISAQRALLSARADTTRSAYRLKQQTGTLLEVPNELKPRPRAGVNRVAGP